MCISNAQLGAGESGTDSVLQQNADGTRTWVSASAVGSAIDQLTGDVTAGPGSGSQTATLAATAVTPGTYGDATHTPQITVDSKGRITSASDVVITGSGGGGLTLLEQHTASSSASLNFTTAITSTYDEYLVELISLVPATNATTLWMRMSTNGGSSYDNGANYDDSHFLFNDSASAVAGTASGATKLIVNGGTTDNTASKGGISGFMRIFNPLGGVAWTRVLGNFDWTNSVGGGKDGEIMRGAYEVTTAVNAFQFLFSSGNIASGTIRVYGIQK